MKDCAWASTKLEKIVKEEQRCIRFWIPKVLCNSWDFYTVGKVCGVCRWSGICAGMYSMSKTFDERGCYHLYSSIQILSSLKYWVVNRAQNCCKDCKNVGNIVLLQSNHPRMKGRSFYKKRCKTDVFVGRSIYFPRTITYFSIKNGVLETKRQNIDEKNR